MAQNHATGFLANAGQMKNMDGTVNNNLLFSGQIQGAKIFITKTSINYVWYKPANDPATQKDSAYRMEVAFKNASASVTCIGSNLMPSYSNYFVGNIKKPNVKEYGKLTFSNLYPNISLELTLDETGFRSSYLLAPGANPSNIQLEFKGGTNFAFNGNGDMAANVPFGRNLNIFNFAIDQYRSANTTNATISFSFSVAKVWQFSLSNYNSSLSYVVNQDIANLIPNPGLPIVANNNKWATYYGGANNDEVVDVFVSNSNFIYVLGNTRSTNFPLLNANIQPDLNASSDLFIAKFKADRSREFSTYLGSSLDDYGSSIAVNNIGEIYVCGSSTGSDYSLQPSRSTSYFSTAKLPLIQDGIITKIYPNGQFLLWSTYFGSSSYDGAYGLAINSSNKVFLVGETYGTNLPIKNLTGGYNQSYSQTTNGSGFDNGFIARFSSTDSLEWSTYYGGSKDDRLKSCVIDNNNNLFVQGFSTSNGFMGGCGIFSQPMPVCGPTNSYLQNYNPANNGQYDVYLAKFNPQGQTTWSTYYGGPLTEFDDALSCNGINIDQSGDVFISGATQGQFPVPNYGNNQITYGQGLSDGFVVRFSNLGVRKWASYIGGLGSDYVNDIKPINLGGFMIAGSTQSVNLLIIPKTGYINDNILSGAQDGFIASYLSNNVMEYSSFIGGDGIDNILSLGTSNGLNIVLGGRTNGAGFPVQDLLTSSGDYLDNTFNGGSDGFLMNLVNPEPPCSGTACRTASNLVNGNNTLLIYPNPNNGSFTIDFEEKDFTKDKLISIYNQQGKIVYSQNVADEKSSILINTSNLSKGIYLVKINTDSIIQTQKIIVQ